MKLCDFDYHLPKELIAQSPIEPRDSSRLMVLGQYIEHRRFSDIPDYFEEGDTLVLNDSKVIPAKLRGKKSTGGKVEVLVISKNSEGYECLIRGKNIFEGTRLFFDGYEATVLVKKYGARYLVDFQGNIEEILKRMGEAPLPPYIKRKLEDRDRYQTVYAKEKGSIAAPTAGLHFTNELLKRIMEKGVHIACITLHIGVGTFAPVKVQDIEAHSMEPEYFSINEMSAEIINKTRGKLIAVGTTTVKALESACVEGEVVAKEGFSELFIYPSYEFKSGIDALITNFHLPRSTPLMLTSAFAGRERLMTAYHEAMQNLYRFCSFGDAMLIFR